MVLSITQVLGRGTTGSKIFAVTVLEEKISGSHLTVAVKSASYKCVPALPLIRAHTAMLTGYLKGE